ncbi:MFS transporter [Kribbella jiaozuonensis]|uniref:MFS transporter n=1 Tax=Kribbella jiaozuonensis TaxID=2575441 RepID=A0A4U3M4U7_9ACTN|nr:MFS transporter [Kribbella jiaozuonensis]TKK79089.1 MFS transporter [Kribbella jiaozuonensis]TKK83159.1 MFS transporter [Kribbella jiaozuonensis]
MAAVMIDRPADVGTRRGLMLAVLLLGQFMALLDTSVVNVAMPTIGTDFHASGAWLQLVVGGYMVAYAMTLITGARLGDLYGRRRMYLIGVVLFTLASLACGLAPAILPLVLFRFAQGIAAAVMVPQIISVIQTHFTGPARAKALSAYGVTLSAGQVAGLVVGGLLLAANLFGAQWRPSFLINVPVGILLAVLVPRLVPADRPTAARRLDLTGLAISTCAVLLLVLPMVIGHELGWPRWRFVCFGAGLVLAVVFVRVERRVDDPLLNLDVLRARGLVAGIATLTCTLLALGGFMFSFTLHLQDGLGESALHSGLTWLPFAVTFGLVGFFWRSLPGRLHYLVVPTGLALCMLGYAGAGSFVWPALVLAGAGMGLSASPLVTQALVHVPLSRAADASGVLTTTIQLSQVGGVTIFGTLYLSTGSLTTTSWYLAAVAAIGIVAGSFLARSVRQA